MKRELIKLIGGVPTLVSAETIKKHQTTCNHKWVWSGFCPNKTERRPGEESSASKLTLYHWLREEDVGKDYEYAKLNQQIEIIKFSENEYKTLIEPHDTNWTYEETKYLWDLLELYDLRFIVVYDRYDTEKYKDRTIEELKDRYYSISKRILESRKIFDHPILRSGYNYEQELKRRNYIERTMQKTNEEIMEDNKMIEDAMEVGKKLEEYEEIENKMKLIKKDPSTGKVNLPLNPEKEEELSFEEYVKKYVQPEDSFAFTRGQIMVHSVADADKLKGKVEVTLANIQVDTKLQVCTSKTEREFEKIRDKGILLGSLVKYKEKKEKELSLIKERLDALQKNKEGKEGNGQNERNTDGNKKRNKRINSSLRQRKKRNKDEDGNSPNEGSNTHIKTKKPPKPKQTV
ncbi:MAG: SANT/Myb-like DNA-binding domain-containing protein [archaeon]|nr:SANT/Myb-like DNA-binding domain-containing protein [archaeon]